MAFILPVGLGLVAAVFILIVSGEVFYLFYWRKRPSACPRLNSVTVAPVNEGEQVELRDQSRAAVVIDVTCAEYQISTLQQDLVEKLFPSLSSTSHEATHHTMVGPPRMLFTIKEETKEELEGLDMDGKGGGRSRRGSRSKSMSDIPLSPPRPPPGVSSSSPVTTPFITPLSSPDVFSSSSPYGTPTRSFSPLVNLSCPQSHSASPKQLRKISCRIMYDYPNPKPTAPSNSIIPPPLAPPSPTRPTFSFLASRNAVLAYSKSWSGGNYTEISSPVVIEDPSAHATPAPPSRRPLFEHLATSSPVHKQAECVVKAPSPLRSCTYEYDDDYDDYDERSSPSQLSRQSSSASSSSSSADRSPNFYCTPPPCFGLGEIFVAPSSKGSVFNKRRGGGVTFSPLSSPSDGDSPYASPLLVLPSCREGDSEASSPSRPPLAPDSVDGIIKGEEKSAATDLLRPEGGMPPIVLPTHFSFQAARSKPQSFRPSPSVLVSSEVV